MFGANNMTNQEIKSKIKELQTAIQLYFKEIERLKQTCQHDDFQVDCLYHDEELKLYTCNVCGHTWSD